MSIRIAIADDHPIVIGGIEKMLHNQSNISIIATYTSGTSLLEGLKHEQPDVLLLDIMMPDMTGKDIAPIVQEIYPGVRILVLSSLDAPVHIKGMMRRGCLGYLLKNTDQQTLLTAIDHVYRGLEYIEPSLKEQMLSAMIKGKKQESMSAVPVLTQREKEILNLIVAEDTSLEIAQKLSLSLRTVEGHRLSLMHKLDAKNTVGLVKIALQLNLVD